MNEVTVLSKVGEGAGHVVGTGLRATRRGTLALTKHGAIAAYAAVKLARTGATAAREARATAVERAAALKATDLPRPDVAAALPKLEAQRHLTNLRHEVAKHIEPAPRRRRWPLVVVGVLAVGGVAFAKARRPIAPPPAPAPPSMRAVPDLVESDPVDSDAMESDAVESDAETAGPT